MNGPKANDIISANADECIGSKLRGFTRKGTEIDMERHRKSKGSAARIAKKRSASEGHVDFFSGVRFAA
jgi:hypothetical protein